MRPASRCQSEWESQQERHIMLTDLQVLSRQRAVLGGSDEHIGRVLDISLKTC